MSLDSPKTEAPKSMKIFFIMIGVWLVAMVCLILGFHLYDRSKGDDFEQTAIPYLKRVIPEISRWDLETTRMFMAAEALQGISDERFTQIITQFSRMGELQSFEEPEFEKVRTDESPSGPKTVVSYKVIAKYANGDAHLNFILLENNKTYEIYLFNLSSKALAD